MVIASTFVLTGAIGSILRIGGSLGCNKYAPTTRGPSIVAFARVGTPSTIMVMVTDPRPKTNPDEIVVLPPAGIAEIVPCILSPTRTKPSRVMIQSIFSPSLVPRLSIVTVTPSPPEILLT